MDEQRLAMEVYSRIVPQDEFTQLEDSSMVGAKKFKRTVLGLCGNEKRMPLDKLVDVMVSLGMSTSRGTAPNDLKYILNQSVLFTGMPLSDRPYVKVFLDGDSYVIRKHE